MEPGEQWAPTRTALEGLSYTVHTPTLAIKTFTPRAVERMRSACVDVITELVDRSLSAGSCDFVADIAKPYPVPIICSLLGAPGEDWHLFSDWAADLS